MRILLAACTAAVMLTAPLRAEEAKSRFFTASDGTKDSLPRARRERHAGDPHPRLDRQLRGKMDQVRDCAGAGLTPSRHRDRRARPRQERQAARPRQVRPTDGERRDELMDHLKIAKAPIQRLFDGRRDADPRAPQDRLITAIFGGRVQETDPALIAQVPMNFTSVGV